MDLRQAIRDLNDVTKPARERTAISYRVLGFVLMRLWWDETVDHIVDAGNGRFHPLRWLATQRHFVGGLVSHGVASVLGADP